MRISATPIVIVLLLVLSGCSNGEPPEVSRPTASEIAVPVMPDLARENSDAGAKAFVKHFIETYNYAGASGDTAPFEALSGPDCEPCFDISSTIEAVLDAGGHYKGGQWRVNAATVETIDWYKIVRVDSEFDEEEIVGESGATPRIVPAERDEVDFQIYFDDGNWTVLAFSSKLDIQ